MKAKDIQVGETYYAAGEHGSGLCTIRSKASESKRPVSRIYPSVYWEVLWLPRPGYKRSRVGFVPSRSITATINEFLTRLHPQDEWRKFYSEQPDYAHYFGNDAA